MNVLGRKPACRLCTTMALSASAQSTMAHSTMALSTMALSTLAQSTLALVWPHFFDYHNHAVIRINIVGTMNVSLIV